MTAVAGRAELAGDRPVVDEQDAAVVRVGDRERPVGQAVRVVGGVEVSGVAADDARMAEQQPKRMIGDADLDDRVVVLLVGDQRLATGLDKRVVVVVEVAARGEVGAVREAEHDPALGREHQDAVVAAIGHEQVPGKAGKPRGARVRRRGARLGSDHVAGCPQRGESADRRRRERAAGDDRRRRRRPGATSGRIGPCPRGGLLGARRAAVIGATAGGGDREHDREHRHRDERDRESLTTNARTGDGSPTQTLRLARLGHHAG